MKIFWSWQSDFSPKTNRQFIRNALVDAIAEVGDELDLTDAERPEIDHDTKNEAGMADIAEAIFKKISEAAVFVADITPIASTEAKEGKKPKALPNPNVSIELGWALSETGYERIITVLNLASGYIPDDLPFDIRNRRVLTYDLPIGADKKTRESVAKKLTKDLRAALLVNLNEVQDEIDLVDSIPRAGAAPMDSSIWQSGLDPIEFNSGFGPSETVEIPDGPRAYLRLSPAKWVKDVPPVTVQESLPDAQKPWPANEGSTAGSFGSCEEGYIRVWYSGENTDGSHKAANVVIWFDETGEFWAIHGTALGEFKGKNAVRLASVFQNWRQQLIRITNFLDHYNASSLRRVELGLVGIQGSVLPGEFLLISPTSRKKQVIFDQTRRDWSEEQIDELLLIALNNVRDAFALPHTDINGLHALLGACT